MNVGSISVGMNVDLATFQSGLQRATSLASSQTALMSAEMKRQSREGAESLRLIGEATDLHVSRPLARVIAQIPGVGQALASLGGATIGAAGLFAVGAFLFEKLQPGLEAVAKSYGLITDAADENAKSMSANDADIIASLHQKTALQESYNRLVLGMKGSEAEKAQLALLQKEYEIENDLYESQKARIQLQTSAANAGLWDRIMSSINGQSGFLDPAMAGPGTARQSAEQTKAMEQLKPILESVRNVWTEIQKTQQQIVADTREEGAQQEKENIRDLQEELKGWNDENNKAVLAWVKLNQEIDQGVSKLGSLSDSATRSKNFGPPGTALPPATSPMAEDQARLLSITTDVNAAWAEAAKVVNQVETAEQKLAITTATLNSLRQQGFITQQQENAALAQAGQHYTEAEEHLRKLQEELVKFQEHSTSATAGIQAFFTQMQIVAAEKGKFTFDFMNQAFKGFEEQMASALVTGRAHWQQFFQGLEEDLLKFAMNQTLALILKQLGGLAGGGGGFFGSLFSSFGGGKAGGGSVGPGMSYIVGEEGPEILNMGSNSGFITPNSSSGSGGIYIDARGADSGVEQRCMRAIQASEERMQQMSLRNQTEFQKRTISS